MELVHKDFKIAPINIFKNLKENMNITIKGMEDIKNNTYNTKIKYNI